MNQHVTTTLREFIYGTPQQYQNLVAVPVFLPQNLQWGAYLTLKEALAKEMALITEVNQGGSVPNLMVTNNADLPLLLLDGEELAGAKQNRIVNTSILLPAHSKTVIPVSCTERGRWHYNSAHFFDSGIIMSSKARYAKSARVKQNLERGAGYDAQQGEVWNDIEQYHHAFNSSSNSRALRDVFNQQKGGIGQFAEQIPPQPGQCGLAVFLNGKLAGFDVVSGAQAYQNLHHKLMNSYAIEALIDLQTGKAITLKPEELQNTLTELTLFTHNLIETASETVFTPTGLGADYRYTATNATASALVWEDKVIHFSAFTNYGANQENTPNSEQDNLTTLINRRYRNIMQQRLSHTHNIQEG
ncbi:hypothetical protein C7N43_36070 [Sphingobacteriales bacterium UPWRP_1]|nr:hypothetical protein C7N43_36070 [Sphingobacteriales bacterium UPWRP_1]